MNKELYKKKKELGWILEGKNEELDFTERKAKQLKLEIESLENEIREIENELKTS